MLSACRRGAGRRCPSACRRARRSARFSTSLPPAATGNGNRSAARVGLAEHRRERDRRRRRPIDGPSAATAVRERSPRGRGRIDLAEERPRRLAAGGHFAKRASSRLKQARHGERAACRSPRRRRRSRRRRPCRSGAPPSCPSAFGPPAVFVTRHRPRQSVFGGPPPATKNVGSQAAVVSLQSSVQASVPPCSRASRTCARRGRRRRTPPCR